MKKLYLHMGFHKTATSSLQQTCRKSLEQLSEQGYEFPIFKSNYIELDEICNHSIPIYSIYCKSPQLYDTNLIYKSRNIEKLNKDYRDQFNKSLQTSKNIILSGEDISILSKSSLIKLKGDIEFHNFKIIPLVVIRSPYEYHCSIIQQKIKTGHHLSITKFISQQEKINKILEVFPETKMFSFKGICKHEHGPVGELLESMGININKIRIRSSNEGISNTGVRIQNGFNKKVPRFIDGALNEKWDKVYLKGERYFHNKFLLTEQELESIQQELSIENEFFKSKLGSNFSDQKIKTSDPESCFDELAKFFQSNREKVDKKTSFSSLSIKLKRYKNRFFKF
ncbi:hypothetical protein IC617_14000 [Neiella sp. HB171785]|uniref:Uncharacterized protein n=1 Tax=Neiella litorisoli TaxID=2771431 RepID=A0A8J6QRT1_9GAMM|nr:hypothetical protein [Neiella litorisoli]MBD1390546.1 hypothetical protein [Neiella litorisoli]